MTDPRIKSVEEVDTLLNMVGYQTPFTVIFLKKDGSQRAMKAMMEKPTGPQKNPNSVPVMDLEKGQWRSFNKDAVIYLEKSNG